MRTIICLVVYFILANLGDTLLDKIGLGIGDAYGISYLSGTANFSISGLFASCVVALISAIALKILDGQEGIGFAIACIYWIWQIWGDFGERSQIGWIGFFIITLENIIMLAGLAVVNGAQDSLREMGHKTMTNQNQREDAKENLP